MVASLGDSTPGRTTTAGGARERPHAPAATRLLAVGAVFALSFAPFEYAEYENHLEDTARLAVRATVLLTLVGKTLGVMLPGILLARLLPSLKWTRLGAFVGSLWVVGVAAWLWIDLVVHHVTGNHLAFYLGFLGEPDVMHWAGSPARMLRFLSFDTVRWGLLAAAALVIAGSCSVVLPRLLVRRSAGLVLASSWAVLLGCGLALQRLVPAPVTLAQLDQVLPISWTFGLAREAGVLAVTQRRATDIYTRHFRGLHTPSASPAVDVSKAQPQRTPNVILIVLDGLRADMIGPQATPKLWRWREQGGQLTQHYANCNTSTGGMFALASGWYALTYQRIRDPRFSLPLTSALQQAGYETHFFTSADLRWRGLERIFGPPHFVSHARSTGPTWSRDTDAISEARALIARDDRPKLAFLYLMSSHWPYSYPPDSRGVDALPLPGATAAEPFARAFAQSVRFLDDLLGRWLAEIDLDENLVIVTGDHGESFLDDGRLFHGSLLSEVQTRVALLIAGPGVARGRAEPGTTEHVDVVPTILHLLGFPRALYTDLPGRAWFASNADTKAYATVSHRVPWGDQPRMLALVSPTLRFSLRLDWQSPQVTLLGTLDEMGLPSRKALTAAEAETFLTWWEDLMKRVGGR